MIGLETIRALWFMPVKRGHSDWLAALVQEAGALKVVYRIRYYRDGDLTHASKDKKNWYEGTIPPSTMDEAQAIEQMRRVVGFLSQMAEGPYDEIIVGEHDMHWLMSQMRRYSWCHVEELTRHGT